MRPNLASRLAALLGLLASCTEHKPPQDPPERPGQPLARASAAESAVAAPALAVPGPGLTPLSGEWLQKLESPGAVVDYVSPPVGATEPRPVVVALHGMDARPEWVCNDFRATFGPWPFVVCARGDARSPANYSWGGTTGMKKAIARALRETEARFGDYMTSEGRVLVTYSQSASMAPAMLADDAPSFAGAFFLEGFTKQIAGLAPRMVQRGLTHALFFATQPGNRAPAEASAKALGKAGAVATAEYGGALGHWFTPKTVPALKKGVPKLVDGLAGWSAYPGP